MKNFLKISRLLYRNYAAKRKPSIVNYQANKLIYFTSIIIY